MHYSFGFFCFFFFFAVRSLSLKELVGHFLHPFHARLHTPMSSTDVNVLALSGMFACVAVRSGKKTVLFCENLPFFFPCFFLLWFCHKHLLSTSCPSLSGLTWTYGGACSASSYMHSYIYPQTSSMFGPSAPSTILITTTKKGQTIPTLRKQSCPVLIRGGREGTGSAWVGIGIYTGFYCLHSLLPWRDSVLHVKTRVLICTSEFD